LLDIDPEQVRMTGQDWQALGRFQSLRKALLAVGITCLFGVSLFGQSIFKPDTAIYAAIVLLGQTLIFVGIIGRLWATLYIGGRKKKRLVANGPYSVTRNPLYFFSTVAAAGIGALTGSISTMIGFGALCTAAFHFVILREERFLTSQIGSAYQTYVGQVPRFLPDPSLYRDVNAVIVHTRLLKKALFDSVVFLAAVPAFKIIEHLQAAGYLPVLFRLP
jgi:protein-S-isoprenylcysteine O-methyltransferase Ste14